MPTVVMSGKDTLVINGHSFNDFADGDVAKVTFPNDISAVKTGKNGNSIYSLNASGLQADLEVKVLRGSADDKFLNNLLNLQNNNFEGFPLMSGTFVKVLGDGQGNIQYDTYILGGGIFSKNVEAKSNVEGDTDQSTSTYMLKFSNSPRVLT